MKSLARRSIGQQICGSISPNSPSVGGIIRPTAAGERRHTLRIFANSRMVDGVTREQLVRYFADHEIASSTWDLFRHQVVTEYAFKVGARPGIVLFLEVDSEDAAAEIVNALPVVTQGLLTFDIDPVSAVAHF